MFSERRDGCVNLESLADTLRDEPSLVWLDSARQGATGRYSILAWDPWLTVTARGRHIEIATDAGTTTLAGDPLVYFDGLMTRYAAAGSPHDAPSAASGLFVVFGYEAGGLIERLPAPKPSSLTVPQVAAFGMRQAIVVDHEAGRSWCVSVADPEAPREQADREARERLHRVRERAELPSTATPAESSGGAPSIHARVEPSTTQAEFESMVRRAHDFIAAGDIFQANLSQEFVGDWSGSAWPLYRALRQINPSPFACFVQTPSWTLVSCSPERLVRVADGWADTRPIAGTRPRGHRPAEDAVKSLELILSEKERAEHIMLVDLARNDLGRVCEFGSVSADELLVLEEYSHVIHLVSNVRGRIRPGTSAIDVVRAIFPGGTITGCPKIRSMEIIHELEPSARGFYTGSCGYLGFDGSVDLNILIRTFVIADGRVSFRVGAGIVADSQPALEYDETLAKAGALLKALHSTMVAHDARC